MATGSCSMSNPICSFTFAVVLPARKATSWCVVTSYLTVLYITKKKLITCTQNSAMKKGILPCICRKPDQYAMGHQSLSSSDQKRSCYCSLLHRGRQTGIELSEFAQAWASCLATRCCCHPQEGVSWKAFSVAGSVGLAVSKVNAQLGVHQMMRRIKRKPGFQPPEPQLTNEARKKRHDIAAALGECIIGKTCRWC